MKLLFISQALQVIREKCALIVREIEQIETGGLGMQMEMEEENADVMEEEEQFVKVLLSNCLFERIMDICLHSFLKWRISEYSENKIDFQTLDCKNTKNTK